jgi:HAD superfamily hydrolase (TIGR01549 family)
MTGDLRHRHTAVFFDLYGTLLVYGDMKRAWSDWLRALYSMLVPFGLSAPLGSFSKECDRFLEKGQPAGEREGVTPFERRIDYLCEANGLRLSEDDVARIADHVAEAWERHVHIDPDALGVLASLRKEQSLALVSNFDHPRHLRKVISLHGLVPFFQSIVVSGEIGVRKPDPGIFRRALDEMGLSPGEVVYVGDTEEDVIGARAAGIKPILIIRPDSRTDPFALDFATDQEAGLPDGSGLSDLDVTTIASLRELLTLAL